MPTHDIDKIRNVVLIGHSGSGKTSLAESILFHTKSISRMGTVESGNTVSDHEPEEAKRVSSIQTSIIPCKAKGHKINFLDTPGYDDFRGEVLPGLRITESAVIVVSATAGVEVGTETSWNLCETQRIPRIVFINKLDRENAEFERSLASIESSLGRKCVPFQIPIGEAKTFQGIIDLIGDDTNIPDDLKPVVEKAKSRLVEAAAENDDDLATKYLEGEVLTAGEISGALASAVRTGDLVPVFIGSAIQSKGIDQLISAITTYLPSPQTDSSDKIVPSNPLSAIVFKTSADPFVGKLSIFRVYDGSLSSNSEVWNATKEESERIGQVFHLQGKSQQNSNEIGPGDIGAVAKLTHTTTNDTLCEKGNPKELDQIHFPVGFYTMAVSPKSKADVDKMSSSLSRIIEEDPSLTLSREPSTNETLLSGMGDVHLEITTDKILRKFGTELSLELPQVPYKETITTTSKAEYKHKKQSGGHGQYGHVLLRLEPAKRNSGFEFAQEVVGGAVPREYIPAVEKGVVKALVEGSLAGYPVVDVKVVLYHGSYHDVDSSGMAFEIAGSQAFKKGMTEGRPTLLEPIMRVYIRVPDDYTGEIIGDINGKRGRIIGMIPEEGLTTVEADMPQSEMLRYNSDLRSLTGGRASYKMDFSHYEPVPPLIGQKVIENIQNIKAAT